MAETSRQGASEWAPPRERRRWTAADGRAMREALRASGDGVIPFAQRHGLHEERVRRWVRRLEGMRPTLAAPVPPPGFVPVRLVEPSAEGPGLEVAVGGAVVRVRRGFDAALLRHVVAALGGDAC